MANFKIASTLLCVLLIGREALAVINKSNVQATPNKDAIEIKDEVVAEDRVISEVYGAPPSTDYGPPNGGGFSGPAPVYGPPELTGHQGPVQVHPPPPPELPPPPPNSYGPPRKPKPHYGVPKPFGPPPSSFGPKPNFGPPKLHFGSPPSGFGSQRPQFGQPPKFLGQGSRFGGHKPGHGPPIPISVEHYGPPNKGPALPFDSLIEKDFLPPPPIQHGPSQLVPDLYGAPPPAPPPGVPAPPTPPDIKYDGWQPIAGLVGAPKNQQPENTYGVPSSFDHQSAGSGLSHGSSDSSINHSTGSHSSSIIIETPNKNVPSDSYGAPIHNQEAQHLQSSVQSSSSHGLPPPPLPQSEPFHNNQGPAKSIPGHQEHQHGNSESFDHSIGGLQAPNFELPVSSDLDGLHGLSHHEETSFGGSTSSSSSSSFHGHVGTSLSLPNLETYGTPAIGQESHAHSGSSDLTIQQLPLHGSSIGFSFSGTSFGGSDHGSSGLSLPPPPPPPSDSYGAPPASSFSPTGRYPTSQSPRAPWQSNFNLFGSSSFNKHHSGSSHHHNRHHGPPRFGPPSLTNNLIPPRTRAPIKFREQVPSNLLANINRYLPPKPSTNYGAPIEQQLPSRGVPHSFKSPPSSSFSNAFGSANSFFSTSPIAAPNVNYGTPLSFNDFNTPAPVLKYGAPNFGPAASFISTSFGNFGSQGNLYNNIASNGLTATYGTPISGGISSGHNCGFQNSGTQLAGQYNFGEDVGRPNLVQHQSFSHSGQSSGSASHQSNLQTSFTSYQPPLINELDLESHERQPGELKDSYGNPINFGGDSDQTGAALTTNDVRANSISSSFSHEEIGQQSLEHNQNYAPGETFSESSSAAVTAALTAQGYGQGKNFASNELSQEANSYQDIHQDGNEALSLALKAEGADGFQIQGSKGTYTLQIQSADGSLGTENSDGSIRHDQVLSNGLLQDILAAIETPNEGPLQIQGLPQPQQLQEVWDDGHLNGQHQLADLAGSHNEVVQQVLSSQPKPLSDDQVALFYNNNGYEESRKNVRSTSKSEAQAALNDDVSSKNDNEAKKNESS